MHNIKTYDKFAILFLAVAVITLLSIIFINNKNNHIRIDDIKHKVAAVDPTDPFLNIKLSAKAAIVWDMHSRKIIYSQNSEKVLPLASLAKVMTAITAVELIPDYTVVTISKEFLAEEGDTGLFVDEKWKLRDLLTASLISSSNDGVRAIASVAGAVIGEDLPGPIETEDNLHARFISEMNKKAQAIGLTNTNFLNENGLDENLEESGAYGSVRDVALMFDYALRRESTLLEATRYKEITITSLNEIEHSIKNTNLVTDTLPGLIGSKTGYTDLAGGNLAVILDLGLEGPYVIAVLGSTIDGRFLDVETLARATNEYVAKVKQ